jgi:threonine dehydrogenase-like Zn-dependent dehydrogenase
MKAVTWHGMHDVRVDTVDDPAIQHPTDAIVRITSTGICGSDLHLYEVLGAFIDPSTSVAASRGGASAGTTCVQPSSGEPTQQPSPPRIHAFAPRAA